MLCAAPPLVAQLQFIACVLQEDAKNYHAWGHRQWVLRNFSLWDGELEYVESLLQTDMRNNSAWNQRHYVLSSTGALTNADTVAREIEYALSYIRRAPANASPWSYLKGLMERDGLGSYPHVREACEKLMAEAAARSATCVNAMAALVDILQVREGREPQPARGPRASACERAASIRLREGREHQAARGPRASACERAASLSLREGREHQPARGPRASGCESHTPRREGHTLDRFANRLRNRSGPQRLRR